MKRFTDKLSNNNLFENYLPIFRVFIAFHVIKKIFLNWDSTTLFVDKSIYTSKYAHTWLAPLLEPTIGGSVPIVAVLTIILAFLFGLGIGRYVTAILLFFSMILYFEPFQTIGNGGDNLLYFVLIYMMFTNSYKHLTVMGRYKQTPVSNLFSNLGVLSILLHLCLVYFISAVHKIHADVWLNGVATYYVWQLERFNSPINQFFMKNSFIIAFSTYFTVLFELLFPFLVWNKQWRTFFLISGVLLHLGIYFTMMIYDFEILFIMIYGFFIANARWQAIFEGLGRRPLFRKLSPQLR